MVNTQFFKRLSLSLALIGVAFNAQLALASSDSGTLTPGSKQSGCNLTGGKQSFVGYINPGLDIGVYSPTGLTGGRTVVAIVDQTHIDCGVTQSYLTVEGFTSDPGSSWLTSITCNGVKLSASAMTSYSYTSSASEAVWTWSTHFGLSNGAQVSCTIVHS
jgi:hypothetical protein